MSRGWHGRRWQTPYPPLCARHITRWLRALEPAVYRQSVPATVATDATTPASQLELPVLKLPDLCMCNRCTLHRPRPEGKFPLLKEEPVGVSQLLRSEQTGTVGQALHKSPCIHLGQLILGQNQQLLSAFSSTCVHGMADIILEAIRLSRDDAVRVSVMFCQGRSVASRRHWCGLKTGPSRRGYKDCGTTASGCPTLWSVGGARCGLETGPSRVDAKI